VRVLGFETAFIRGGPIIEKPSGVSSLYSRARKCPARVRVARMHDDGKGRSP